MSRIIAVRLNHSQFTRMVDLLSRSTDLKFRDGRSPNDPSAWSHHVPNYLKLDLGRRCLMYGDTVGREERECSSPEEFLVYAGDLASGVPPHMLDDVLKRTLPPDLASTLRGIMGKRMPFVSPPGMSERPQEPAREAKKPEPPPVTWDDVVGLDAAKVALRDVIETPHAHKKLFQQYGIQPTKGILLYGPPGCGKTMIVKAAAHALGKMPGNTPDGGFIYVKGPELMHGLVGQSEEMVRNLFTQARQHKANTGFPAVVFVEEAESVFAKRKYDAPAGAGGVRVTNSMVTQFLSEMDGLDDAAVIMVLATNREDELDPAVLRDGRVDRKIHVGRPTREAAELILSKTLEKTVIKVKLEKLIKEITDYVYDEKHVIFKHTPVNQPIFSVYLRDILNGAMLTGFVQKASLLALHDDIGKERDKASGVKLKHLKEAVDYAAAENVGMDHRDVVMQRLAEERPRILQEMVVDQLADIGGMDPSGGKA